MTPDRVNQQSGYFNSPSKSPDRDSKIHDRIAQFNSMTSQHGFGNSMSKQLERKTADAALKRAMLGREEAESEMRKYRDEARSLRKLVEEGRERERRVGERLETVMVSPISRTALFRPLLIPQLTIPPCHTGELRPR